MENLLNETLAVLKSNNLEPKDVLWIGNKNIKTDWENFAKIADVNYDNGFGGQVVATDLKVVGKYWWIERHEYDGSEWWEFKQLPKEPENVVHTYMVIGKGFWQDLDDINN